MARSSRRRSAPPFAGSVSLPRRRSRWEPFLQRLGVVWSVHELVVRTAEVGATSIEQEADYLGVLLELVLALADGWEGDAVRRELDFVPSRAEAAIGTAL